MLLFQFFTLLSFALNYIRIWVIIVTNFFLQAAEKALKAARYLKHYEMIKEHNLRVVAITLDDPELKILAASLESLIISSPHLLYPNKWPMPTIPYEQYDQTASNKAIDLATKILAIVYRKVYS